MDMKNLTEIRTEFVEAVTLYLSEVCHLEGEDLALKVSCYLDWNWPVIEASHAANGPRNTGLASDFTCDFICRMLAGRI